MDLSLEGDVHGILPQQCHYQPSDLRMQGPTDWAACLEGGSAVWILHLP